MFLNCEFCCKIKPPTGKCFHKIQVISEKVIIYEKTNTFTAASVRSHIMDAIATNQKTGLPQSSKTITSADITLNNDWQQNYDNVTERNAVLFKSGLWSDIEFYFETENIVLRSHRVILAAASNVLAANVYGDMRTNRILIAEIPSECFKQFLRYIYTDCIDITTENAACLMYTAHKYNIKVLEVRCIAFIESDMKLDNVCIYFDSLTFDSAIRVKCLKMIKTQTYKIVKTKAFLELDVDSLKRLLKLNGLNATETQLYEAMLNWADSACRQLDETVTDTKKRILLQDAERHIRFPTMTFDQLMDCVLIDLNFLTKREIGDLSVGIWTARPQESAFCSMKRRRLSETNKCNEHIGRPACYVIETKFFGQMQSDGIEIRTKTDGILKGFGVYGMANESEKMCVTVNRKISSVGYQAVTTQDIKCDGKCKIYPILLSTPLTFSANSNLYDAFIFEFSCEGKYYYHNDSSFTDDFNILLTKTLGDHNNGRIAEIYFDSNS